MKYQITPSGWIVADEAHGKPLKETMPPSPLEYGTKAVSHYEEQNGTIVKVWDVVPWTEEERKAIENPETQEETTDNAEPKDAE
jgi:hypothetical protein